MGWINNLRFREKLIIPFLIVALLIGIIGIIGIKNMYIIKSNEDFTYNIELAAIQNMSAVKSNLIQINFNIYKILNEKDNTAKKTLIDEIGRLKDEDDRLLTEYENNISSEKDRIKYNELTSLLIKYRSKRIELISYLYENKIKEAESVYKDLVGVSNEIVQCVDNYVVFNAELAKERYDKNSSLYEFTRNINIVIIFAGLLLAIILGLIIASTISRRIEKLSAFSEALINGDLDYTIDIDSKDEIGILAKELNKAGAIRKEYESKLSNNYQELEASYEEIAALEEELREKYNEITASEESLRKSDELYKLITQASYDVLWDWYIKEDKKVFSSRWYKLLGYDTPMWDSITEWLSFIHPEDVESLKNTVREHWQSKTETFTLQYRIRRKKGDYIWIETTGKTIYDNNGQPYRSAGSHREITDMIKYQQKLKNMAYYDYLTNLPNRQYMYKKLKLDKLTQQAAIMFIDIDNFKYVNDTMGHNFGDNLIKEVGKRIKSLTRSNDTLIRLGGDEFVIFARNITTEEQLGVFADRLLLELTKPFEVMSNSVKITSSMGIAIYPKDGSEIDELVKKADIAMYNSKYQGKNKYTFFINDMNEAVIERMNIEKHLRKALANEEFLLFYQPQVNVESGEIEGFEALIRWNSPELGFISPLKFIEVAEENHMIIDIGKWVLETACKFVKNVHDSGISNCHISVNVSVLQILQSDFVENVCRILEETDLAPQFLELEITETVFIDSYEVILKNIQMLKNIGIKLALDDFGKGYSSLSYLKQLPINTLKIDKSFVDDIENENDSSLVQNIIMIGHKMNMDVVAEGVESKDQMFYLRDFQCDKIQGYLFSKPVTEEEALSLINNNRKSPFSVKCS